jgi:low temperature requirement protein LtrA
MTNRGKAVPLELFFDLVFVFGVTQVTSLLASDPTWTGFGRGLAVLALLWWAWVGYSWLGSAIDPEEGWLRIVFFAAMGAMLVVSLATVDAFGVGSVTFAVAFLAVRVLHVLVFFRVASSDRGFRRSVLTLAPSFVIGPALIVAAAFIDGPVRGLLWIVAIAVDYGAPLLGGSGGWRINPSHFAERHGLVIIIALGESIVAFGVGTEADTGVRGATVVMAMLVIAVAAAFWWSYFDVVAIVAEQRLSGLEGQQRNELARDSFSYLHLFIVVGIVFVALSSKKVAPYPSRAVSMEIAVAMGGGAALVYTTLSVLRWRNIGAPNVQRLVAAAVCLAAVVPIARWVSGIAGLVALGVIAWSLVTYEATRFASVRHQIRHGDSHTGVADPGEANQSLSGDHNKEDPS